MSFFDIDNTFFSVLGYPISYLEFAGVITGLVAVYLSSLANIWSWGIGIINVSLYAILFYQVQLYPDMFLQVFFFVTNILGWWRWANPRQNEKDSKQELKVSFMKPAHIALTIAGMAVGTFLFGLFAANLHSFLPTLFHAPSAMPYADSFMLVASIFVSFYMIQKKIECWILWIIIDMVGTGLYFVRDIRFTSLLYFVYCLIAAYGLYNWVKEYRGYVPAERQGTKSTA